MSECGSKRFLIHENILNDMRHPCCTMISSWFTILPPFTSVLYKSLVKAGKIVNQELIIVQQRAAYRLVCFRVWEIIWNHFQTHRTTYYRVISLITSNSLSKWHGTAVVRFWLLSVDGCVITANTGNGKVTVTVIAQNCNNIYFCTSLFLLC